MKDNEKAIVALLIALAAKLFETMIFDPDEENFYQMRCTTWDEAEEMHADAVKVAQDRVRNADDAVKQIGTISARPDNKEDT